MKKNYLKIVKSIYSNYSVYTNHSIHTNKSTFLSRVLSFRVKSTHCSIFQGLGYGKKTLLVVSKAVVSSRLTMRRG